MVCTICGSNVKNPYSSTHVNSKFHKKALNKLESINSQMSISTLNNQNALNIVDRINKIETQLGFVISKLNQFEEIIRGNTDSMVDSQIQMSDIRSLLLEKIPIDVEMSLDELWLMLPNYSWFIVERALKELIEEEIIEVNEGKSNKKLLNQFGKIKRKV